MIFLYISTELYLKILDTADMLE